MFKAYVEGYSDRMIDYQIIALQSGYWSAYYSGVKHPKSVSRIAEDIVKRHKAQGAKKLTAPKPDVDVDAYLEMEAQFKSRLEQQGR